MKDILQQKNILIKVPKILKEKGYPQDVIDAIMGHADYTGVERKTLMAKLFLLLTNYVVFYLACAFQT